MTIFFSIAGILLHFVDDLVSLMKAVEVVSWSLYNSMFSMSVYRISTNFLLPFLEKYERSKKDKLLNGKRL
jgi:hypothetical protein